MLWKIFLAMVTEWPTVGYASNKPLNNFAKTLLIRIAVHANSERRYSNFSSALLLKTRNAIMSDR